MTTHLGTIVDLLDTYPAAMCGAVGACGGAIKCAHEGWKGTGDFLLKCSTGGFAAIIATGIIDIVGLDIDQGGRAAICGVAGVGGWELILFILDIGKRFGENLVPHGRGKE